MNSYQKNLLLVIISNVLFGLLPILIKLANQLHYSSVEETFFRMAVGFVSVILLWAFGWQSLKLVNVQAVFWRGFFGGLSLVCYFTALQTTSSGKGTLLNYTYILWTNIFAVLFFKQKSPKYFFLYLLFAAIGVELVLDVSWDHLSMGDAAGLLSGITGGAAVLGIKRARYTDTALSVFASFVVFSLIFSSVLLFWGHPIGDPAAPLNSWTTPYGKDLLLLITMGIVSMLAQMMFTQALGKTSLALGSLLTLSVPVLAALFGLIFLGEPLTPHFGLGMLLVLVSCGVMVLQENQAQ